MPNQGLGVHEALELHELLSFKNVCVTKSSTMTNLVTDDQLKALLQEDVQSGSRHIQELQQLLQKTL